MFFSCDDVTRFSEKAASPALTLSLFLPPLYLFSPSVFLFFFKSFGQIEDANFSLSHPNQYFVESQKILGGGKDIKREADTPQRSQESAAARGAQEAASKAPQGLAEMTEELDSFFQDD